MYWLIVDVEFLLCRYMLKRKLEYLVVLGDVDRREIVFQSDLIKIYYS